MKATDSLSVAFLFKLHLILSKFIVNHLFTSINMSVSAFFVSDLHGSKHRYSTLFSLIEREKPNVIFLGGDLLPSAMFAFTSGNKKSENFISETLIESFSNLKKKMSSEYPEIFLILGNDDGKADENIFLKAEKDGLWNYVHGKKVEFHGFNIYGYSYIPPSPFLLKDWERYDVSRFVDPGCLPPEEGSFSVAVDLKKIVYQTIKNDLDELVGDAKNMSKSIFLFHSPPYQTHLDRAALDGKTFDYVPLDVNIGSIAIKRFIEKNQPLLTLHGHVHESTSITGYWCQNIGKTMAMNAAHNGTELSLIRFNLDDLKNAKREII
jgi:Icc-related predicted phosphoesterase